MWQWGSSHFRNDKLIAIAFTTAWKIINGDLKEQKVGTDKGQFRKLDPEHEADPIRRTVNEFYDQKQIPTINKYGGKYCSVL